MSARIIINFHSEVGGYRNHCYTFHRTLPLASETRPMARSEPAYNVSCCVLDRPFYLLLRLRVLGTNSLFMNLSCKLEHLETCSLWQSTVLLYTAIVQIASTFCDKTLKCSCLSLSNLFSRGDSGTSRSLTEPFSAYSTSKHPNT